MKIAVLGHKHIATRDGGIEVVVSELVRRYAQYGQTVYVYDRAGRNNTKTASEYIKQLPIGSSNVKIYQAPSIQRTGFAAIIASFTATMMAIRQRPDVIHYHAEGTTVPLLLAKIFGIKTVVTIHGLDWTRAKWGRIAKWYIKFAEKITAQHADEIIVLTKHAQQYFMDTYGRKTWCIPNGVTHNAHVLPETIHDAYQLSARNYLLYVGRVVPEKGLPYLINAYRRLDTHMPLVIAGKADSPAYFEAIQRMADDLPEGKRIIFTGHQEGTVLAELYSNPYLLVLPSDIEGLPMALLEAMSYGNCCLTSDIEECVEAVGPAGTTFSQGDVEDLALKLQHLLDNPDQVQQYRDEAAERAQQFSWDTAVQDTLQVYKHCAQQS